MSHVTDRVVSQRVLDWLNFALVPLVVVFLLTITGFVIYATAKISGLSQQQIEYVQQQNDTQICAQHEMIIAVRQIGIKLGLPVEDIVVPSTKGLDCATN